MNSKPLNCKSYGHIPHLPGSRMGPSDHKIHEGQASIATVQPRKGDVVTVTEKLDGSCCSVACVDNQIVALGRAGYLAQSSQFEQHQLFAHWVRQNEGRFECLRLNPDMRMVGEWLAQAHGTRYKLKHEPFVPFDLIDNRTNTRRTYDTFLRYARSTEFTTPHLIFEWKTTHHTDGCSTTPGVARLSIESVMKTLGDYGFHGALETPEGAVWRVEHDGVFDFMTKFVRPDKQDGKYLSRVSGEPDVWNWKP